MFGDTVSWRVCAAGPDCAWSYCTFLLPNLCLGASFYWKQRWARRTVSAQNEDCATWSCSLQTQITLSLLLFLQVLLHNYLISSLLKQLLESEHLRHIGAGPFTPKPSLSLNAPFCCLHNYHSERMPSTPRRAKKQQLYGLQCCTLTLLLIAVSFQGGIVIAQCHAILT